MGHRIFDINDWYNLYEAKILDHEDRQYLWRNPTEKTEAFTERLKRASYTNWVAKVIDTYLGYVFYSKPKGDEHDLPEWNIIELSKSIGLHSLIGGRSWVLVLQEEPRVYRDNEVKIEKRKDVHKVKITRKDMEINIDLIRNKITKNVDGDITPEEDFKPEQLFSVTWNETGRSMVKGIDHLAVQIYNFSSVLDYHIYVSMTWWGVGPADMDGMPPPYQLIKIAPGGGEFKIVHPETAAMITIIRTEIDKRIMQLGRVVGLESEFAEELKFESGLSKAYSLIDTNANVLTISGAIMLAANNAGKIWGTLNPTRPVPTIGLEPLLRPDQDEVLIKNLKELAFFVGTPIVTKEAQSQMVKLVLNKVPGDRMKKILEEIDNGDGILRDRLSMLEV